MKRFLCIVLSLMMILFCCNAIAVTKGEENAVKKAQSYLGFMNFSYNGIIEQLAYEGFSESECKYAADNCGADWYDQAAGKAASYLDFMSFSKTGLIDQLEYEGFTKEESEYGAAVAYGENPAKPRSYATGSAKEAIQTETVPTDSPEQPVKTEPSETVIVDTSFDLSALSYEELIALGSQIVQELVSRPEYKEVLVPAGVYKVGTDIPAGKWIITATEGMCEVYWGKSLDEYGVSVPVEKRIDYLDDWGSNSSVTWNLVDNTYIVITRNGVTFSPYVPNILGF